MRRAGLLIVTIFMVFAGVIVLPMARVVRSWQRGNTRFLPSVGSGKQTGRL